MDQTDPIATLIERLCHTREQLAQQLGVSPAALYSWSVGRRSPRPGNRTELARIARAHARDLTELAGRLERSVERPQGVPAPAEAAPAAGPRAWRSDPREGRLRSLDARRPRPIGAVPR